jgi:hypothetical protein
MAGWPLRPWFNSMAQQRHCVDTRFYRTTLPIRRTLGHRQMRRIMVSGRSFNGARSGRSGTWPIGCQCLSWVSSSAASQHICCWNRSSVNQTVKAGNQIGVGVRFSSAHRHQHRIRYGSHHQQAPEIEFHSGVTLPPIRAATLPISSQSGDWRKGAPVRWPEAGLLPIRLLLPCCVHPRLSPMSCIRGHRKMNWRQPCALPI